MKIKPRYDDNGNSLPWSPWAYMDLPMCAEARNTLQAAHEGERDKVGGIYAIQDTKVGTIYVGSAVEVRTNTTSAFAARWQKHNSSFERGKLNCLTLGVSAAQKLDSKKRHENPRMQNIYNKHGWDRFEIFILELLPTSLHPEKGVLWIPKELVREREQFWLDYVISCSALGKRGVFNANLECTYSPQGRSPSPETREKLRQAKLGKKLSAQHVARITLASTGRKCSDESKQKMSAAHKGKPKKPEAVAKLKEALSIPLDQIDAVSGALVCCFSSFDEAQKAGFSKSIVSRLCEGIRVEPYRDFFFRYASAEDPVAFCKKMQEKNISSRGIRQIDIDTNDVVAHWPSPKEAGRALEMDPQVIRACLSGARLSAGGYRWERVDTLPLRGKVTQTFPTGTVVEWPTITGAARSLHTSPEKLRMAIEEKASLGGSLWAYVLLPHEDPKYIHLVLDHLNEVPIRIGDIERATQLSGKVLRPILLGLQRDGKIDIQGEHFGTTYRLVSNKPKPGSLF